MVELLDRRFGKPRADGFVTRDDYYSTPRCSSSRRHSIGCGSSSRRHYTGYGDGRCTTSQASFAPSFVPPAPNRSQRYQSKFWPAGLATGLRASPPAHEGPDAAATYEASREEVNHKMSTCHSHSHYHSNGAGGNEDAGYHSASSSTSGSESDGDGKRRQKKTLGVLV